MTVEISEGFIWPSKGDRLLRAEGDWDKAVNFAEEEMARGVHIWDGYVHAGTALIEECERSDSRMDRHELVYPILFCYRHGLELAMKWIIGQYGRFAGVSASGYLHHDLWQLWMVCKKIILKVGSDGETEALLAVEQIVKEFHVLDEGSFSFRYATDKKGATIRLPNVIFDLANIKEVMEAVNNLFTGVDGQLSENAGAVDWH